MQISEKFVKLDRALQLHLLKKMAEHYPSYWNLQEDYPHDLSEEYELVVGNLYYLMQHKLIEDKSITINNARGSGFHLIVNLPTINQRGMDFLADDGGLSAILNVVTVKFETETLKAILENKINQSNLDPDYKQSMLDGIQELPAESIKHLTMKLLDEGLENLPGALVLIGTYLGLS